MKSRIISLSLLAILVHACAYDPNADNNTGQPQYEDQFDALDSGFWHKADGWANGAPFLNGWCGDQISFANSSMQFQLSSQTCAGSSYAGSEYRSNDFYGYGRYEARLKAAAASGVITSFFLYTGPADGNPHDEIDVEIFGQAPSTLQVNYWTNGVPHETLINLGFNASQDFHTYSIDWQPQRIDWYVDGQWVHGEDGSNGTLPSTPGRIMMNLWACDNLPSWCGSFDPASAPLLAQYDLFRLYPARY